MEKKKKLCLVGVCVRWLVMDEMEIKRGFVTRWLLESILCPNFFKIR